MIFCRCQQQRDASAEQLFEDGFINLLQSQHAKRDGDGMRTHIFVPCPYAGEGRIGR